MKYLTIFGLTLLVLPLIAVAQKHRPDAQTDEVLIKQLQSADAIERTRASQYIYEAGVENAELYALVANVIEERRAYLDKESPKVIQQEVAWHVKALACSGNEEYMPLLDELSRSTSRTVAKHAKASKKLLLQTAASGRPRVSPERVKVISDIQAEKCEYIEQQYCSTRRNLSECIEQHKVLAAQVGANSILMMHDSDPALFIFKKNKIASYYRCSPDEQLNTVASEKKSEMPSYINELKELAALRDDGMISEEEFQKKKTKILAGE